MAGLFPKAPNVQAFWTNILNGVDAISDPPKNWLGEPKLFDPDAQQDQLRIYTKRGGFLGDLSRFDPRPFGAMPISVLGGEPDQFLALKCAHDALVDARLGPNVDFPRERTGCVLGHAIHANRANVNGFQHGLMVDQAMHLVEALFPQSSPESRDKFEKLLRGKLPKCGVDTMPALIPNMMTGRICNRLDLMGPNYIMDAACASTTLAIEAAVSELRRGRADVMLAGGVNTTTSTLVFGVFCQLGALSRSARVRPFSKGGDGTLLGEGQGIFVLKRLEDALVAEDRIYAVIKSIGSSSDGRSSGLMAPRLEGETLAMRRAYELGGIDPMTIDLIEAHGTGIPLGDRTEIDAMRQIFGDRRKKYPDIALGSVKSMIGHCIPAAGAASIIKTAMALHEKVLPPTLCEEVSPELGFATTPFYVNTETRPWLHDPATARRAAVNAFGFGGINSHLILEEAPPSHADQGAAFGVRRRPAAELFCFAAADREGLIVSATIAKQIAVDQSEDFGAYADRLANEIADAPFRLAVIADSWVDLLAKLEFALTKTASAEAFTSRNGIVFRATPLEGKIAFLFPGEHSQYPGMLGELALQSPVVRRWLDRLEGLFGEKRDLPHRHLLYPAPTVLNAAERSMLKERLAAVAEGSEAVFFADTAYFKLLSFLGVRADFMLGHSTGENAALVASGTANISDDEISDYIRRMNVIFSDVQSEGSAPSGALLTVGAADEREIEAALAAFPELSLTMDNCPNQKILFGNEAHVAEAAARLASRGAICARLPLSFAYHTEHVRPLADRFAALFASVRMGEPKARLYSCSTAEAYPEDDCAIRATIVRQYVTRVRFTEAIRRMHSDGARIFVEVGADSSLSAFVRDTLQGEPHLALSCDNPKRDSLTALLMMLGQLFAAGRFDPRKAAPQRAVNPSAPKEPALESALPLMHLSPEEAANAIASFLPATAACADANAALESKNRLTRPISVWTRELTELVRAPAGAVVVLAKSDRIPDAPEIDLLAAERLTPEELDGPFAELASRSSARRFEWLLGRIAAKEAVLLLTKGDRNACVLSDPEGRPVVRRRSSDASLFVSITHKNGQAVAAAAFAPIGVDLEQLRAVQDVDAFAQRVLTDDERAYAELTGEMEDVSIVFWSMKEAAAKASGALFVGQERAFSVDAINSAERRASVRFENRLADVSYVVDGGYVCTLSVLAAE
jgi:phosphopantetheine--protein transferase-like protein